MKQINFGSKLCRSLACTAMLSLAGPAAAAPDQYQYRVLFSPGEAVLEAEQRGRIMIYDGLENALVERVLTEQFDRIENMMFVRTRYPRADGSFEVEDDCD